MFILKKIVQPLVLPPGCIVMLLLLWGIWMIYKKRQACGVGFLAVAALMWCLGLSPLADRLLHGLEKVHPLPSDPQGDVIVMLGGAVHGGASDMTGQGAPNPESCERILTTARLYRKMRLPVILTGGRVLAHQPSMGTIYKRMLVDLGIPENDIILETRSRDTIENARYTVELCQQRKLKHPIVVTHAAHMPRAVFSFAHAGMTVTPFPCGFRTWPDKTYHWPDFMPRGYENLGAALHEYLGLYYYRWVIGRHAMIQGVRGRPGKNMA